MLLWLVPQTSWNQFVLLSAQSRELQSNVSSPVLYCDFLNAPGSMVLPLSLTWSLKGVEKGKKILKIQCHVLGFMLVSFDFDL